MWRLTDPGKYDVMANEETSKLGDQEEREETLARNTRQIFTLK